MGTVRCILKEEGKKKRQLSASMLLSRVFGPDASSGLDLGQSYAKYQNAIN